MKIGYSMLLGEYIDSEKISYTDCKSFQIVCPVCKEPVFKVERKQPSSTLHYLSHYEKSKTVVSDCELRVESISYHDRESTNNLSRGQKLEYFLSLLRNEIIKREFGSNPQIVNKVKKEIRLWMNAPGVRLFRDLFYKHQSENDEMNKFENLSVIFDDYVDDFKSSGDNFPLTGFAISTQKRIASDVCLHLLSAKTGGNFTFLFCIAFGLLSERISSASKSRSLHQFEKDFIDVLNRLTKVGKGKSGSIITALNKTPIGPPYAISGSTYLTKLASEICFEMLGILLRLPYFEMLERKDMA